MTSYAMMSVHFDLKEAAKCFDMPLTLLAFLSSTRTKYKMVTTFGLPYEILLQINDSWRCHNLKRAQDQ